MIEKNLPRKGLTLVEIHAEGQDYGVEGGYWKIVCPEDQVMARIEKAIEDFLMSKVRMFDADRKKERSSKDAWKRGTIFKTEFSFGASVTQYLSFYGEEDKL